MEQSEFLAKVLHAFDQVGIEYMVTGSIAAIYYGEPRYTNDIDVVAEIRPDQVPKLRECFPEAEFYFSEETAVDAIRRRGQFNIIHPSSGLKADIILVRDREFSKVEFSRRVKREILAGQEGMVARPEDVILMKMDYYRQGRSEKHLRDIAGIVQISGNELEMGYLTHWAQRMGLSDIWTMIQERVRDVGKG